MSIQSLLDELNPEQLQATTTDEQHCLVLAGAGCGKTKTIVARAAFLIDKGIPANQIQILTFTRRSASEIVARVELALGEKAKGLRASTFHTFCMYLLRRQPKAFGLENFSIIDRDDQLMLFRMIRGKDDKNHPEKALPKPQQLCDVYSFARNTKQKLSLALEKQLPEFLDKKPEIANIMKEYEERKHERNFLDYDDILAIVATALAQSPALVEWVAQQSRVMLVDEMQDTNPLQWALLEPLKDYVSLFCVGDDAQSIYGFRGADFENIHHFTDRVPNAKVLKLSKNYRSTQEILDLSNWLLDQSSIKYNKRLDAHRGDGIKPKLHIFPNEFDEAKWIAIDIKERHFLENAAWGEHMVLVRSAYAARHVEAAFIAANVPYRFIGGMKLLETAHVKDLMSLLRVIANHQDDIAWMRFLTLWNGVGDAGASKLAQKLLPLTDFEEIAKQLEKFGKVPQSVIIAMQTMVTMKTEVEQSVILAIETLSKQLEQNYEKKDWSKRVGDFDLVKQLAVKHHNLSEFLEAYVLDPISISEIERQSEEDIVTLITIHSAKGTEQNVCYVANVTAGQYPHARAQGNFDEVEEERRVLYVALTRAKNELILTKQNLNWWARNTIDEQGRKIESYFLNDLSREFCASISHHRTREQTVKSVLVEKQHLNLGFGIDLD